VIANLLNFYKISHVGESSAKRLFVQDAIVGGLLLYVQLRFT
jgi:hypothetical protein